MMLHRIQLGTLIDDRLASLPCLVLAQHALRALNVDLYLFLLLMLKLNVLSIARPVTNWCVLADSLSEKSVERHGYGCS